MKDVYQVLHQKEMDLVLLRLEIEALRSIIPPFADDPAEPTEATGDASLMSGHTNKWFLDLDERAA